jgi:ABC-type antimicrobial peptide transport system permease subunit
MGLVVFVFASVLMLAEGLEKALVASGSPDNVVFVRRSSETEVQSIIERDQASIVETLPAAAFGPDGSRLVARELVVLIGLNKRGASSASNVTVRGVDPRASFEIRPRVKIITGRPFRPGAPEIVVGKSVAQRFAGAGLGQTIDIGLRPWTVVGVLDSGGAAFDSEIWGDVDALMAAFKRSVYSSVIARLENRADFPALRDRVLADPRLTVEARRETEYYAAQSELMARFIRILGVTLTMIFSIGAMIGAMVTMYAAVANRVAEIGALRALGFQRRMILGAFLAESFFLSLLGGVMGLAGATLMDRITISTMNWQTFSDLSFRFTLSRSIVLEAMAFAVVMGVLGGALPAFRASRLDIVTALRLR